MRKLFSILILCLAVTVTAQVYLVSPVNVQGLDTTGVVVPPVITDIADVHYFFENNEADSSGNSADGSVTNMAYGSTTPAQGSYYGSFISSSTIFAIPGTFTTPFSISCWVRQTNTGDYYRIMSPWYSNSTWEKWQFWIDGVLGDLEFRGYQNSTSTLNRAGTANSIWTSSSSWRHIVFTYDNGPVTIYYEGALVTTGQSTWGTDDMDLNATVMAIGQYFNGDIDDFSKYSVVLSQTQVTTLYNGGVAGTRLTE